MAKRKAPAFQLYADDFYAGTIDMTNDEVGAYIRLLCLQWTKGGIGDRQIRAVKNHGDGVDYALHEKFQKCEDDGLWRNERLEGIRANQQARGAAGAVGGKKSLRGPGFAYAIARAIDGAIKLGASRNPVARKSQLSSRAGCEMKLLHKWRVDDMAVAESVLHGNFAEKRIDGEWFTLTKEDVLRAQQLMIARAIPPANSHPPTPSPTPTPNKNTHTHTTRGNQRIPVPDDMQSDGFPDAWQRWLNWVEATQPRPVDPIRQESLLMELGNRGAAKAARDIDFSIQKDAKTILDSDHDFQKFRSSSRPIEKEVKF